MSRRKTPTQVICREVLQEVIEWKRIHSPDENTIKRGIRLLLERRMVGISTDEDVINGLIGGVVSMLSHHERRVSSQLDALTERKLTAISGFLRPEIPAPNPDVALYDEDATSAMKRKLLFEIQDSPEGIGDTFGEIDFLSGLSSSSSEE